MSWVEDAQRRRFDPNDPAKRHTVVTTSLPGSKDLLRCVDCDDLVEVLWPELPDYWSGRKIAQCATCRGDHRVLDQISPPAGEVIYRRNLEQVRANRREHERLHPTPRRPPTPAMPQEGQHS